MEPHQQERYMQENLKETALILDSEHKGVDHRKYNNWKHICLGISLAFMSGFTYTLQNAAVVDKDVNFFDVLTCRYGLILVMTLISLGCYEAAKTRSLSLASKNTILSTLWIFEVDDGQNICFLRGSLVLLGSLSFSSLITDFYCVKNMPLGDASAIIFSAPLPTMVFSAVFLGSRLRMYKIFCGLLLYTGIMLVIRPPFIFKRWLLIWSFTLVLSINILYCRDVSVDNKNYYFGLIMGFALLDLELAPTSELEN